MLLLPLPLTPQQLLVHVIRPAWLALPAKMRGTKAEVQAIATGLQETRLNARRQMGNGPARGLTQFEKGGGVRECVRNPVVTQYTEACAALARVPFTEDGVWAGLEFDDELAMQLTRLNYWRSPRQLPELGDADGAWKLYNAVWAPGKPRPETWADNYAAAWEAVRENT